MLESHSDRRSGKSGSTAANRINHDHERAFGVFNNVIDCFPCPGFFNSESGQILTHGLDEHFRVWHAESLAHEKTGKTHGNVEYIQVSSIVRNRSHPILDTPSTRKSTESLRPFAWS
jgi:hypothetical protein